MKIGDLLFVAVNEENEILGNGECEIIHTDLEDAENGLGLAKQLGFADKESRIVSARLVLEPEEKDK